MRNVMGPSSDGCPLPGETENARPKNAFVHIYLRALTDVNMPRMRGVRLKLKRRHVVYRGRRISSSDAASAFLRNRVDIRMPGHNARANLRAPRRVSDIRIGVRFSAGPRGARMNDSVPRIAYINPSGTCLPHIARQFAVFRGIK